MKKTYLILLLTLMLLTACKSKELDITRIESDILNDTGAFQLEFLDEIIILEDDDETIKFSNKISYQNNLVKTYESIHLNYNYDSEEKAWQLRSYKSILDHYEPLVDAYQAQAHLTKELGLGDNIPIENYIVDINDPYLTIKKIDTIFDGSDYSDYIYLLTYDNGAVYASAKYKITYKFLENRGEWYYVDNKIIEDFEITTSLNTDSINAFNEMFLEYYRIQNHGLIDLKAYNSNIAYSLSLSDENLTMKTDSELSLEGLDTATLGIELNKNEAELDIQAKVKVTLELDEVSKSWKISNASPILNQTKITLSKNFIGNWNGYYRIQGKEYRANLEITKLINNGIYFEGIMSFGSSDTFEIEDGSYSVIGGFLEDELLIELSQWITQPKEAKAYTIYIKDLSLKRGSSQMIGNMTWMDTDDYKAYFVKE